MNTMTRVWILIIMIIISPTISFMGWILQNNLIILGGGVVGLLSIAMICKIGIDSDKLDFELPTVR